MWEYYVITELRIIFQDKNNKIQDKNFCIHKETKHFIGYDDDFDSDESGYEDARDLFYKKQLKKYDKIIILYNNGHFIKADYEKKYKDTISNLIGDTCKIISISKMKFAQMKW
jgi:hypothetical protein